MASADARDLRDMAWPLDGGYVACHVFCLATMPLLLLAINSHLFINPGGNDFFDPWVYRGFLLSFPDLLHRFGDTYYATRLPWLLPGFALNTILPPLAANYVLHLTFFYLLLLSTYALAASGGSRSMAFVTTVLVGLNPLLLTSFSWDYVDGAGIVFLLIALYGLERAARAASVGWWPLMTGAAMACLVATNLALLTALPACGAFLLVRLESQRGRSAVVILAIAAVGALVTLVTLGALNRAMGGPWLFLQPSIRFGTAVAAASNIWKTPAFDWSRAEWVQLPVFAAIGAIISLAFRRLSSGFARAPQVALLVFMATWLLSDLAFDTAFFRYSYYVSYLVVLALIALPLQSAAPAGDGTRRSVTFELAVLMVLAAPHLLAWIDPPYRYGFVAWTPVVLFVAVFGLQIIRPLPVRWAVFVVGLMVSYAASSQYWKVGTLPDRVDFAATTGAHQFIARSIRDRATRIWYPPLTPTSPPFHSIACTYLCDRLLVNGDLPRLTRDEAKAIAAPMRLVFLVNRASEAEQARTSLRAFGLDYRVVAQEMFGEADRTFLVIVADVVPTPS